MDQKAWLWRKKSSEKTIVATDNVGVTLKQIDEQVPILPTVKEVGSERSMKNLNEKLASVLFDSHSKDDLVPKQAKLVQEADAGEEELEAEAVKKELDEALRPQVDADEKLPHLGVALVKCVKQINFVQEEEKRVHDAVIKTSDEFEKVQKELEKNSRLANERIAKLAAENSRMSKALLVKERIIEDLRKRKSQVEAEFSTLMSRLDATEKENAFLKYEFRILEKELEIRNEEMEYTRRSVEATNKQHLESVKKVSKLEAECERLRLLVRKKLSGSAASAKMNNEIEMLGRDQTDMRRRKLNPSRDLIVRQATVEGSHEISLVARLHDMEEENKTLKEIVTTKGAELQASRMMFSRTASRLSYVESQLKEICTGQKSKELTSCVPISSDLSIMSVDNASDDGMSSSGSWANALISELEHFRDGKVKNQLGHKGIEVLDKSLMDDFVEMEKLAIVSTETTSGSSYLPEMTGQELVPLVRSDSSLSEMKQEIHSKDIATEKSFDWLQVVLKAMLKQRQISKQSLDELLEDIRIALGYVNYPTVVVADLVADSKHPRESKSPNTSPAAHSSGGDCGIGKERRSQHIESSLGESIRKIIELIERVNATSSVSDTYSVHVFQWNPSELHAILQKFVGTCNNLLSGKTDLENFVGELSCSLDWIMNNCIAPKDASSARNKVKKHFGLLMESNTGYIPKKQSSAAPLKDQNALSQGNLREENRKPKDELKSVDARLDSATDKSEAQITKLHESEEQIGSLETEVKIMKESKEMIEDQMENQKSIDEDLGTQLAVANAKLNDVSQKFSSLEVELEYKNNCCEELEATCLELQLQLESVAKKETPNYGVNQEGKQSLNGWEITAASVKLAECQENILNLGKQLKALASPREAVLFDKVFSTTNPSTTATNNKKLNQRFSLRDRMLVDDSAKTSLVKSSNTKTTLSIEDAPKPSLLLSSDCDAVDDPIIQLHTPEAHIASKNKTSNTAVGSSLAIVPIKKRGIGLLMKLFRRRKKENSKNSQSLAKV